MSDLFLLTVVFFFVVFFVRAGVFKSMPDLLSGVPRRMADLTGDVTSGVPDAAAGFFNGTEKGVGCKRGSR